MRGGIVVGCETVEQHAQVGPERRLLRIEALYEIALQGAGEEALCQVFRFLVALMPFQADVFVDRLPVERGQLLERVIGQSAAGGSGLEQRRPRGWKPVVPAADGRVRIERHEAGIFSRDGGGRVIRRPSAISRRQMGDGRRITRTLPPREKKPAFSLYGLTPPLAGSPDAVHPP